MESRVDDAMRQPRTSVAPLAVGAERPSGRLLLNLEGHAPHEFLRDLKSRVGKGWGCERASGEGTASGHVGVCARNLVDQLVDGSKGAVVSEHERVVGLQVLARGLGANLLAVEEADRDAVLVRHVGRGVDVGAGVANHLRRRRHVVGGRRTSWARHGAEASSRTMSVERRECCRKKAEEAR